MKNELQIRVGQKLLNLNDFDFNGEFNDLQCYLNDCIELRFESEFKNVGTASCDDGYTTQDVYELFLTKLVEVVNIDTDEIYNLNESEKEFILKNQGIFKQLETEYK